MLWSGTGGRTDTGETACLQYTESAVYLCTGIGTTVVEPTVYVGFFRESLRGGCSSLEEVKCRKHEILGELGVFVEDLFKGTTKLLRYGENFYGVVWAIHTLCMWIE